MISQLRRGLLGLLYFSLLSTTVSSCAATNRARTPTTSTPNSVANTQPEKAAVNSVPVIHVFVALADNVNQGIVPVSASLGNGDNAASNLLLGRGFRHKNLLLEEQRLAVDLSHTKPKREHSRTLHLQTPSHFIAAGR